jgi:hypothetical protein
MKKKYHDYQISKRLCMLLNNNNQMIFMIYECQELTMPITLYIHSY